MEENPREAGKSPYQLVLGILYAVFGAGMFFRIPQVSPKIAEIDYFASSMPVVLATLYLAAVILLGGGVRKIIRYYRGGNAPEDA